MDWTRAYVARITDQLFAVAQEAEQQEMRKVLKVPAISRFIAPSPLSEEMRLDSKKEHC
jgi:hypothetical protein